jgi:enoyl-CoA hydratase/carnithine racemase
MNDDILFKETAGIGFITLNRPDVLNALSTEMCLAFHEKLNEWQADENIQAVVINGAGGKAFCAGGDVRAIVEQGHEDNQMAQDFFSTEYKMNAGLYHFKKPFIVILFVV